MKNTPSIDKAWVLKTFLALCRKSTPADPNSTTTPSTPAQTKLLETLAGELRNLGLERVNLHGGALLTAHLPANSPKLTTPIGLLAHVDTSPDAPSSNIKPIAHPNYDGGVLKLPHSEISPAQYPELPMFKGHTLITSAGDTLLGADDKAGVVAILAALRYLHQNPETQHNPLQIAFTSDEEIGRGTDLFPTPDFKPDFAYTLDSAAVALLEYENFNAASATITISGRNTHPGYARDTMLNALDVAHEIAAALPRTQKPQTTAGRAGFFHLNSLEGTVEKVNAHYIIRDFSSSAFASKKERLIAICDTLNARYKAKFGFEPITLTLSDSYLNMRPLIPSHVIAHARRAIERTGHKPAVHAIRGGTDGARLSYLGIPTPNLSAGGMNFHSVHEYASLEAIVTAAETVVHLASYKK